MAEEVHISTSIDAKNVVGGLIDIEKQAADAAKEISALENDYKSLNKQIEKTDPGTKEWQKLNKELKKTKDALKDAGKEFDEVDDSAKASVKTISSLQDLMLDLSGQLEDVEIGSEAFEVLSKTIRETEGELRTAQESLIGLSSDDVAGNVGRLAGGLGGIAASAALIADEDSALGQFFGGLESGIGILVGVQGAIDAVASSRELLRGITVASAAAEKANLAAKNAGNIVSAKNVSVTIAQTIATSAQSIATGIATIAAAALNAVLAINPIFLLITALAAIAVGLAVFSSSTEIAEERNDEFNKTLEKVLRTIEKTQAQEKKLAEQRNSIAELNADAAKTELDQELSLAEAKGASAEELADIKKRIREEESNASTEQHERDISDIELDEKQRLQSIAVQKKAIEIQRVVYSDALAEGNSELATSIKEEIAANREKYRNLVAQNGDANRAKKRSDLEYTNGVKKRDAQAVIDEVKTNKQRASNYKSFLTDRISAERAIIDQQFSLTLDSVEKELAQNVEKFKRLREDAKNNVKLTATERTKLIEGFDKQREQAEIAIEKGIQEKLAQLQTESITNEVERSRVELEAKQERTLAAAVQRFGAESDLVAQLEANQAAERTAIALERDTAKVQSAFELQQRIDAATLAAKEAAVTEGTDEETLLSLAAEKFEEDLENLRNQLAQGELVHAEFDANELLLKAQHEAAITDIEKTESEKRAAIETELQAAKSQTAKDGFALISDLADLFGGANEKRARAAFKVDKAAKIASATTSGIESTINAFKTASSSPITAFFPAYPFIQAGFAGIFAATGIARIAKTQFTGGGGGASIAPSGGAPSAASVPSVPNTGGTVFEPTGGEDTQEPGSNQTEGQPIVIQNNILESDITKVQQNVASIEEFATFE